jgi:acetyltransferase-like isoleucine patch superfamily enzyme
MTIKTGKNCKMGKVTIIGNGEIILGNDVIIKDNIILNISGKLFVDDRTIINDNVKIEGNEIHLGKESWLEQFVSIGGGSCHGTHGKLEAGDWLHMGRFSFINIAREVTIGDEVGLGEATKIYTHGSYLSYLDGFPINFNKISIGTNVWIPNAIVTANIGNNVVVASMSLVNKDIPDGCLAGGIPAHIIKANCYPIKYTQKQFLERLEDILTTFSDEYKIPYKEEIKMYDEQIFIGSTLFDFKEMKIDGSVTELTEKFKNHCRRYGVRFKYYADGEMYKPW